MQCIMSAPRTRIILALQPPLFRELLHRALEYVSCVEVVAAVTNLGRVRALLAETRAQWVVVLLPRTGGSPAELESLLAAYPHVRCLVLAADGRHAEVFARSVPRQRVEDVSLNQLRQMLCLT